MMWIGPLMMFGQYVRPEKTRLALYETSDRFEWDYLLGWGNDLLNPETRGSTARCRLDGSTMSCVAKMWIPGDVYYTFTCTLCGAEYTR